MNKRDQKTNIKHHSQILKPMVQAPNSNLNPAVQLLLQSRNSSRSRPSNKSQVVGNQFFNPNPSSGASTHPKVTSRVLKKPPNNILEKSGMSLPLKSLVQKNQVPTKMQTAGLSRTASHVYAQKKEIEDPIITSGYGIRHENNKPRELSTSRHSNSKSKNILASKSSKNVQKPEKLETKDNVYKFGYETKNSRSKSNEYRNSKPNEKKAHRSISVLEAAARLSFPWPAPSVYEEPQLQNLTAEELKSLTPSQKKFQFLKEIRSFFETHQDLLHLAGVQSAYEKSKNIPNPLGMQTDLDESLEAVMESLKLAFLQNGIPTNFRRSDEYKPFGVPKWEEVQTNWPGFDCKPVPNWTDYTTPAKIVEKKSEPGSGMEKDDPKDGGKSKSERKVHYSTIGQF